MAPDRLRAVLNRVPEITLYFWVIKLLATTVGETAADSVSSRFGLSLGATTLIMSAILIPALAFQFSRRRYLPLPYWLAVVLISIVGTLITDNMSDGYGVSLWLSTAVFSVALIAVFSAWFWKEGTLSIHTVWTGRRESFYWLAVLCTFALGTAGGDLAAEQVGLGYWRSALMFAALIGIVAVAHRAFGLHAIPAFWIAYVLTRPLGASVGDFLSQPRSAGGLGLGTALTSTIFLLSILAIVAYLTISRLDRTENMSTPARPDSEKPCPGCELPLATAQCERCGWPSPRPAEVAA